MSHGFSCELHSRPVIYLCTENPDLCNNGFTFPAPLRVHLDTAHGITDISDDSLTESSRDIAEWVEIENMEWQAWLDAALLLSRPSSR